MTVNAHRKPEQTVATTTNPRVAAVAGRTATSAVQLAVATTGFLLTFWAWALISPLGARYAERLGLSSFQQALLVATPVLVGSLGRIPAGALTDALGARRMMPAVALLTVLPVLYLGLVADGLTTLLLGGFFLGLGGTSFAVGVPHVNAWFAPSRRGTAIGVFGAGMGGTAIAVPAGGRAAGGGRGGVRADTGAGPGLDRPVRARVRRPGVAHRAPAGHAAARVPVRRRVRRVRRVQRVPAVVPAQRLPPVTVRRRVPHRRLRRDRGVDATHRWLAVGPAAPGAGAHCLLRDGGGTRDWCGCRVPADPGRHDRTPRPGRRPRGLGRGMLRARRLAGPGRACRRHHGHSRRCRRPRRVLPAAGDGCGALGDR